MTDNPNRPHINFEAPAVLRKWPSINNERRGTAPYEIVSGTLGECLKILITKPSSTSHLYEINTLPQPPLVSAVMSGEDAGELARLRDFL
jgi:hypothetical protein